MPSSDSSVRVLFVCTGNTCRSPLAVAALVAELGEEASRVEVGSAGTAALEGQPANGLSREVAKADGLDLSGHRARPVTPAMLRSADFVFVMDALHRVAVEALGAPRERVHVISEYPAPGDPGMPVSDPFGASKEAYEECWRRIRHHVRRLTPEVKRALAARNAS
ncbi:MAG: low molecular weight protein arginine phosphatase [Candidatus Eisenbacteria bacterium]